MFATLLPSFVPRIALDGEVMTFLEVMFSFLVFKVFVLPFFLCCLESFCFCDDLILSAFINEKTNRGFMCKGTYLA